MEALIEQAVIKEAIFDDDTFNELVEIWGMDEVRIACSELAGDLLRQLTIGERKTDEWRKKAGFLQSRLSARLATLKLLIAQRNREQMASAEIMRAKQYSDFAEQLARALYVLDPAALAQIDAPGEDITSTEWLHKRVERRARKEAGVGLVQG